MSEARDWIEGIFESRLIKEPVATSIGIQAAFKKPVNIASVTQQYRTEGGNNFKYKQEAICKLAEMFGVVSLTNATFSDWQDVVLTGNKQGVGLGLQDPFHRDPFDDGVTLLIKLENAVRQTPTDYAYARDVRKAISEIDRKGMEPEVIEALDFMQEDSFTFSLTDALESRARAIVQNNMPDFNERIFDLIPDHGKLRKHWQSAAPEVVIHSNSNNYIVHGRGRGPEAQNVLFGRVISP